MTPATDVVATAGAAHDAALLLLAVKTLPLAAAPLTVTPLSTCVFRLGTSVALAMENGAVPVARLLVICPVKSPVPKPCEAAPRLQVPLPEHWKVVPVSTKFPPPSFNCNVPVPAARMKVPALAAPPMPKLIGPTRASLMAKMPPVPPPKLKRN